MAKVKIPAEADNGDPLHVPYKPKEEDLVAIIDTREPLPLDLSPMKSVRGTLETGDFSYVGGEHWTRIERKAFPDFLNCVTHERERFEKEIIRLKAYPDRMLIIEASWQEIEAGDWPLIFDKKKDIWRKPDITPQAALMSIFSWMSEGIPVTLIGDPPMPDANGELPNDDMRALRAKKKSQLFVRRALFFSARRQFESVRRTILGKMIPYMIPEEKPGPPEEYV